MSPFLLRTSPSTQSLYAQSTPAFHSSRLHGPDASSSSSPPNELLATPRDRDSVGGRPHNGRKGEAARRSVRVRGSSSGGQSSPVVLERVKAELTASELLFRPPSAGSYNLTQSRRQRPALPPRPVSSTGHTSNTLALAQAHGISADQFEEAKQQVMRFLRTDTTPPVPAPHPAFEHHRDHRDQRDQRDDKARAKQTPVVPRSQSFPTFGGPLQHQQHHPTPLMNSQQQQPIAMSTSSSIYRSPGVAARSFSPALPTPRPESAPSSSTIDQNATFGAYHDQDPIAPPARQLSVRTRPSLEEIAERTGHRTRHLEEDRKVREWAEQSQSSDSSSDDERAGVYSLLAPNVHPTPAHAHVREFSHPRGATRGSSFRTAQSPASLLPSPPSLDAALYALNATASPAVLPPRGMMERFMSDRPTVKDESDLDEQADVADALIADEDDHPRVDTPQPPHSPPRGGASTFDPSAMMTSPAPSRGHPASVFDSPDISRLLMSELHLLNANAARLSPTKNSSPADAHVASETLYSSPYPTRSVFDRDSPFSSGATKRQHDVFSSDEPDSTKRSRWVHSLQDDNRAVSPTPSATASLRAPSFCDSSPAMSDRASASGAPSRHNYPPSAMHPASAPDFAYHGLPSSSPASSQHSYSEPHPRQHRSSPGPSTATSFAYQRGGPTTTTTSTSTSNAAIAAATALVESSLSRKRAPLKRAETLPAALGPDGSYSKPSWSYAALIGQAIFSTEERKISLADIYSFIMTSYPYYRKEDSGWQNSIRHNLSLNECFIKTARGASNPGKGCLWAIAKGCEDQFADGGFTKKGSAGNGRKPKAGKGAVAVVAAPAARFDPPGLLRPTAGLQRMSHDPSPAASSRGASPALSNHSSHYAAYSGPQYQSQNQGHSQGRQNNRRLEPVSPARYRQTSPTPPPPTRQQQQQHPGPPSRAVSYDSRPTNPAPVTRHVAAVSDLFERQLPPPSSTALATRRDSIASASSQSSVEEPIEQALQKADALAPPYVHRPALPPAPIPAPAPAPVESAPAPEERPRRTAPSPPAASPPTSVYHRLAGPYQPISFSNSVMNHRALALLASPEAAGIMPVHPDVYDRTLPPMQESPVRQHHAHFLPALHIFPGSGGRRIRTRSEENDDDRPQSSMFSPAAQMHTQSPISSMRGERRAPMSPVQTTSEAFEPTEEKPSTSADPEKKRATASRSHLPSVAALADGAETFRTPPRLRSPSSRLPSSALLQAAMVTPGGRARPWGVPKDSQYYDHSVTTPFSKRHDESSARDDWSPFGSRAQVAAEMEHFSMTGDSVLGSGVGPQTPRLSWGSPSTAW